MDSQEQNQGRLIYLITHPRVASNLLVKILSIPNQPNVIANEMAGGYFFLPAFITADKLRLHTKSHEQWTPEERQQVQSVCQSGFDKLQSFVDQARASGKTLFVKEHANIMANPCITSRYAWSRNEASSSNSNTPSSASEPSIRLQVPPTYGSPPPYSPLNDTLLPDSLLSLFTPTFLIRHPALVFPSCYRTMIDNESREAAAAKRESLDIGMTFRWSRRLFELYNTVLTPKQTKGAGNQQAGRPVIVDADDVINHAHTLVPRLAKHMGLSPAHLTFSWSRASDTERDKLTKISGPLTARFLSTIWASEGILKEKAPDPEKIDLEVEAKKWREEFGDVEGKRMEVWVKGAMEDYLWLRERRLRPDADDGKAEMEQEEGGAELPKKVNGVTFGVGGRESLKPPPQQQADSSSGLVGKCVSLIRSMYGNFWGFIGKVGRYIVGAK